MQVKPLRFANGASWMRRGLLLLQGHPVVLFMGALAYISALLISALVPVLGLALPTLLSPALSLGLTVMVRRADEGQTPLLGALVEPFRNWRSPLFQRLMMLGVINTLATLLAFLVANQLDDGTLQKVMNGSIRPDDPTLNPTMMLMPMLVFFVVYTPVQMALWYAPLFVAWHDHGAAKSMFTSLAACWLNRGAFVGYLLSWLGMVALMAIIMIAITLLFGRATLVAQYLLAPIPILLFAVFFCSFWFSYKDSIDETAQRP